VKDTNVPDGPDGNMPTDEVEINMLGALVLNRVGEEVDDVDIVAVDQSDLRRGLCSSTSS
jgi:hypothetical protein